MSNVLIGIIGVVLFIGLALAGALILGDDFRSATSDSKAAAVVQSLGQVVGAASMANLKLGYPLTPGKLQVGTPLMAVMSPRFLKAVPVNPSPAASPAWLVGTGGDGGSTNPAAYAIMMIGSDSRSKAICDAVNYQTSGVATPAAKVALNTTGMTAQTGCVRTSSTNAGVGYADGDYVAYVRI